MAPVGDALNPDDLTRRAETVPPALDGVPLDRAVRTLFESSWGQARRWIARGKISLDGEVATDGLRPVAAGGEVALDPEAARPRRAEDLDPARVVYLDRDVVVVNKGAGISTVPFDETDEEAALCHQVQRYLARRGGPRPKRRRSALPRVLVVHRLDRGTSGLLVFARNYRASQRLGDQFREHAVGRRYLGLAHGEVRPGTLRTHLLEDRGDGLRGSVERSPDPKVRAQHRGKEAITHIEVEERLARGRATLVSCRLETGRTNQIRIHLSEIGHPLLGETLYLRRYRGEVIPASRLMLHAGELGFDHPGSGQPMRFVEPLPPDMEALLNELRAAASIKPPSTPRS